MRFSDLQLIADFQAVSYSTVDYVTGFMETVPNRTLEVTR